jgi:hypothetical protein
MGASLANACTHDAPRRSVCADSLSADYKSADYRVLTRAAKRGQRRKEKGGERSGGEKMRGMAPPSTAWQCTSNLSAGFIQAMWRQAGATTYQLHDYTTTRLHDLTLPKSATQQTRSVSWRGGSCSRVWSLEFGIWNLLGEDGWPCTS